MLCIMAQPLAKDVRLWKWASKTTAWIKWLKVHFWLTSSCSWVKVWKKQEEKLMRNTKEYTRPWYKGTQQGSHKQSCKYWETALLLAFACFYSFFLPWRPGPLAPRACGPWACWAHWGPWAWRAPLWRPPWSSSRRPRWRRGCPASRPRGSRPGRCPGACWWPVRDEMGDWY